MTDDQALERYRYMLSTAPAEDIERAHEEAFARLTPDQRRQALQALAREVPPSEIQGDDPASLARTATRAEIRQPGTIERAWGSGAGPGLGGWFLTTLAASFIGTAIAQSFFDSDQAGGSAAGAGGTNRPATARSPAAKAPRPDGATRETSATSAATSGASTGSSCRRARPRRWRRQCGPPTRYVATWRLQKRTDVAERIGDVRPIHRVVETVLATCNRDQRVRHAGCLEGRRHQDGLLVGDIGVVVAMQEERRRIRRRDEPDRAVRPERSRVERGIVTRDVLRPQAMLPAEEDRTGTAPRCRSPRRSRPGHPACPPTLPLRTPAAS